MSIGLYDADMAKYTHVPFNLELMKMAAYYKKNREIVTLSPLFSPERYSHFVYRKDYYDGSFDPRLLQFDNIEYGGLAFSNNRYIALPLDIEKQVPNTSIYSRYRKDFATLKQYDRFFGKMADSAHFRLSLDGQTIWDDYEKQICFEDPNFVLFLHDYNLNDIKDSDLAIKDTMKNLKKIGLERALAVKFPIQVNQEKDFFKWLQFLPARSAYTVQYTGIMSDEAIADLTKIKLSHNLVKQIEYIVAPSSYEENHFLKELLPQIFKQVIFLQMHKQKIILKSEDYFFSDCRWEKVLRFLNSYLSWARTQKTFDTISVAYFASQLHEEKRLDLPFSKQDAREIFQFVGEQNYELFKNFYECSRVQLIGGHFE